MPYLSGKVVWITGASSGIGEALVYEFARNGCRLIISARRREELERVRTVCQSIAPSTVEILPLDLSKADTLPIATESAIKIYGHVDVLVNNGGISQRGLAKETSLDVDRRIMEVDYFGTVALTKYLLPHILSKGTGHFVVTSSMVGIIGTPYRSGYSAAKHALHGFFDSLRAELWKDSKDIYVTIICPGWINTNLSLVALKGDGTTQDAKDDTHAKGLSPEFVAKKIVKAVVNKKSEIYVGGTKETLAGYLKRYLPGLFERIIRNVKVK
jgi:short-subunit dehydrogenase